MNSVVCLKWGDKYSVDYVNNLYSMVVRNSNIEQFHCITDDSSGIRSEVKVHNLTEDLEGWWQKVTLFNPKLYPGISGEVLYLDLDIVITDSIQPYLQLSRTKDIVTMKDPWFDCMNSSVMRWNRNQLAWVWDKFNECKHVGRPPRYYQLNNEVFQGDQNFLDYVIHSKQYFPDDWTKGWKAHGKHDVIQKSPRIVIFNGKPDPHELLEVEWIKKNWQ